MNNLLPLKADSKYLNSNRRNRYSNKGGHFLGTLENLAFRMSIYSVDSDSLM